MAQGKKKLELPKSLYEMKFMKKAKEKLEREQQNTDGVQELYSSEITDEMRRASDNIVIEAGYSMLGDYLEGRISYNGMNPEIERLMEIEEQKLQPKQQIIKDITDDQLSKKLTAFKRSRDQAEDERKSKHFKANPKSKKWLKNK